MAWAVNTQRGCVIQNDDIGEIPALTAIPVTERQKNIARHLRGVIVFDKIIGVDVDKVAKDKFGHTLKELQMKEDSLEEMKTYQDFMKEYKNPTIAAKKWDEYQKLIGVKK